MKLLQLLITAGSLGLAALSLGDGFVNSVTVSASQIVGGAVDNQVGHVHIAQPAGLLGETVFLSTNSSALHVPLSVYIEPGSTLAAFDYDASDLTDHPLSATIFAGSLLQLFPASQEITINPMFVKNISTDGAIIVAGCSTQLRLTLNAPTARDIDVQIAGSDPSVSFSTGNTVHFQAGDRSELILLTVDAGTKPKFTVNSTMPTGLTRHSDIFRTTALQIVSLEALQNPVNAGTAFSCRVTLNGTPVADTPIDITGGSIFTFPSTVMVDGGTNASTFSVLAGNTMRTRTASITAKYADTMRSVSVTVNP